MIDPDMRNAIYQLHQAGMQVRQISRQLHVSRNSVRAIIAQQGAVGRKRRNDKIQIDGDLLRRLYHECDGLASNESTRNCVEEEEIQVSYPTLDASAARVGAGRTPSTRVRPRAAMTRARKCSTIRARIRCTCQASACSHRQLALSCVTRSGGT